MSNKYWIGLRESEIHYKKDFFTDYIVLLGKRKKDGLIQPLNQDLKKNLNHNNEKNDNILVKYESENINKILKKDSNAEFMFYNQIIALKYFSETSNIICLNNKKLIYELDNKLYTREYYKDKVSSLQHYILSGKEINIKNLNKLFNDKAEYIVQSEHGSGGSGTLVFKDDCQRNLIDNEANYIVTKYCKKAISTNVHLIITKNKVIIFPASIQIIENQYNHLIYKGCDFIGYNQLPNELKIKQDEYAKIIGEDLRKRGYLGICGIDFIIDNNKIYFMEINSRFQTSSTILNKSLIENHQESLQEMNYKAFKNLKINYKPITVNYGSYIFYYDEENANTPTIDPIEVLDESDCKLHIEKLSYWKTNVYDKSIYNNKNS